MKYFECFSVIGRKETLKIFFSTLFDVYYHWTLWYYYQMFFVKIFLMMVSHIEWNWKRLERRPETVSHPG